MTTPTTHLTPKHMGHLRKLLWPVAADWVAIADQLGMESYVATIRATPSNTKPSEFLRDLLDRWLNQGHPTLESLCEALQEDIDIVRGPGVATELEKEFSRQKGD